MIRYGWSPDQVAKRVAKEIGAGWLINVGIGMPTALMKYVPPERALLHSENGLVGMTRRVPNSPIDPDVLDPAKNPVSYVMGASFVDSSLSFAIMRGGHLDLSVMGAYQVSRFGDIANWSVPGARMNAIGGAADLAIGAKRVWVMMSHVDRNGMPKILEACSYPLTARGCVSRVFTNLGVFSVAEGLVRVEDVAPAIRHDDLVDATGCALTFAREEPIR